jgi:hypothetical protein
MSGISPHYWQGYYWTSWLAFQADQGFVPSRRQEPYPDEFLLRRLAELALDLNKVPTYPEMKFRRRQDPSFPNWLAFERLGCRAVLLAKLERFCEGKPELAQVAGLIEQHRSRTVRRPRDLGRLQGFVYLARCGEFQYEIGRERGRCPGN